MWCMIKNPSYERAAISILSSHRRTWCSSINMIHPDHSGQYRRKHYLLCTYYSSTLSYLVQLLLLLAGIGSSDKVEATYENEKRQGMSCVLLRSQTFISLSMTHPSGIRSYRCTTTEMQQRSYTVPPVRRSGPSRVVI